MTPNAFRGDAFRRHIWLCVQAGQARGVLVDDFHHVRIGLSASAGLVADVQAQALRLPWTTCVRAGGELQKLVGMNLDAVSGADLDRFWQCTHMLDLAALGARALAEGRGKRFDIVVDDPRAARASARIGRDDDQIFSWMVDEDRVESPEAFAGISLRAGFREWVEQRFPADVAEAALVLRRSIMVARGRRYNLDSIERPLHADGRCFSFQPSIAASAQRVVGSSRTDAALGGDDEAWLNFED